MGPIFRRSQWFINSKLFVFNSLYQNVIAGKTYRFRISNVGLTSSINFRIQGHSMKLVEVEGSHTLQNTYSALDIHLGQSYSVLVTANQPAADYYVVVSSRFTSPVLTTTAVLHYSNSYRGVSGPPPGGPTTQIDWSLNQARSIRYSIFFTYILIHEDTMLYDIFSITNVFNVPIFLIYANACLRNFYQLEPDGKWA